MNKKQTSKATRTVLLRKMAIGAFTPLTLFAATLEAATVHLAGSLVDFYYDDSQSSLNYLGTPTLSANSNNLIFAPTAGLMAQSSDGIGIHTGTPTDILNASFTFRAIARDSNTDLQYAIASQLGGYQISGNGFVDASNIISVLDAGNVSNRVFSEFTSTSDFTIADGNAQLWGALGRADLSTASWEGVSDIFITVQNNFSAASNGLGDSAMIHGIDGLVISLQTTFLSSPQLLIGPGSTQATTRGVKPWVRTESALRIRPEIQWSETQAAYLPGIMPAISQVPLPASTWLFGSGLAGIIGTAFGRRRKTPL